MTKIDVCIKAVDAISTRIHKLRDEELLPQITELIHGYKLASFSLIICIYAQWDCIDLFLIASYG